MFWPVLLYNLLLLPVDLAVLFWIWQSRGLRATAIGVLTLVVASGIVAIVTANTFLMMRLTCIGWFAHIPVVLLLGAWLNRQRCRALAVASALVAVTVVLIAIDAFLIEPNWLQENQYTITSEKVTNAMRIVVLADIQTDRFGDYERRVLKRTMDLQPDMILLAGDYFQVHHDGKLQILKQEMNAYLRQISFQAPLGIYAVEGNNDTRDWATIFDELPVHASPETIAVDIRNVRVTCLSMRDSFWTKLDIPEADPFHIALGHSPNFALGNVRADLLIAGHTHGGQVRIPGLGPIITLAAIPRAWASGMTQITDKRTLIVSRGIGMERAEAPRIRFFCRPELVIVDVRPDTSR